VRRRGAVRAAILLFALGGSLPDLRARTAAPTLLAAPIDLGFEEGPATGLPPGWILSPPGPGFSFKPEVSTVHPFEGVRSVQLVRTGQRGGLSGILQQIDARPWRGQRIALQAAVRGDAVPGQGRAFLYLQVHRTGSSGAPVQGPEATASWRIDELEAEVPSHAESLQFGVLLAGDVHAAADAFTLVRLGSAPGPGDERPRPLNERGLGNLEAFARLVGLLRFFHPSDGAARLDWNGFTRAAIPAVEAARDSTELAGVLSRSIASWAPTVAIFSAHQEPPAAAKPPSPAVRALAWRHYGLGTGTLQSETQYRSLRVGGLDSPDVSGSLQKVLQAGALLGRRLRLEASVRGAEGTTGKPVDAFLFLEARAADGRALSGERRQIERAGPWRPISLDLQIPLDAVQIGFGLTLRGAGQIGLDDVRLTLGVPTEGETPAVNPAPLLIDGFEDGSPGAVPPGWILDFATEAAGFSAAVSREKPRSGRQYAELSWSVAEPLPDPEEPLRVELGGGVAARIPLAVWADALGSLPRGGPPSAAASPAGFLPSGNDRATRLAAVILAGSALEHFYPFFDAVGTDWPASVRRALNEAALDADAPTFLGTLSRLIAELRDGHAFAEWSGDDRDRRLPLLWRVIRGELIVTSVAPSLPALRRGDRILAIDGRETEVALAEAERRSSGATAGFRRLRAVTFLASGALGQVRRLQVRRGDEEAFEISVPCSLPRDEAIRLRSPQPPEIAEIRPGIWYVDLDRLADPAFEASLPKLSKAQAIVFDLRGYPTDITPDALFGHLIDHPVPFGGDLVPIRTRPDRVERFALRQRPLAPRRPWLVAPAVFLTDERAISRAEIYLSLVEEEHLGTIVGMPTAGTRGEMDEILLPGGYRIHWSGARALKKDGRPFQGIGIVPEVIAEPSRAGVVAGRDELLERALAVAKERAGSPR
jgi:hypothetical protein